MTQTSQHKFSTLTGRFTGTGYRCAMSTVVAVQSNPPGVP